MTRVVDRFTNYRSRYGYPVKWAIIAEFWWRLEHLPHPVGRYEGVVGRIRSHAYGKRHLAEKIGSGAFQDENGQWRWA